MTVQVMMKKKIICYMVTYTKQQDERFIIMGDFNKRGINWERFVTDGHGEKLLDLSQNLFLTQHVLEKNQHLTWYSALSQVWWMIWK